MDALEGARAEIKQMQAALRVWVGRVAAGSIRGLREVPPPALLAILCAAAISPVLAAAGGLGAVVVAGSGVLSSVGGGALSGLVTGVLDRSGRKEKEPGSSPAALEGEIAQEISRVLATGDAGAHALRAEIASVLREIDAGGTVLRAAMQQGNEEIRSELVAVLSALGSGFDEMRFLINDVGRAAAEIQRNLDVQGADVRAIIEQNSRQSIDIRLVREEMAVMARRAGSSSLAGRAGDGTGSRWLYGCPYRGLLPFEESDAEVFYGRERLTAQLTARIAGLAVRGGMLFVTGASGAGKSSLLRAGLLPALARGQQVAESQSWPRILITPTASPLTELAARLAALGGGDAVGIRDGLALHPGEAHLAVWQAVMADASRANPRQPDASAPRLALIVDQFEQVFTLSAGPDGESERQAFITALCAAATRPVGSRQQPGALVVIAVRGDFWDRCAGYSELAGALQEGQFVVGPMTESDLRLAITGPADAAGLRIEPALTDTILGDLRAAGSDNAAGVLPLLSQAMSLTWDSRDGDQLTSHGYGRAGGVGSAVQTGADKVYDGLSPEQQSLAREIVLTMTIASGDGRFTRRPQARDDLYASHPDAGEARIDAILEAFAAERLMVLDAGTAQLSHDVLLTAWPRLRGWLEEDRASWVLHGELAADAESWHDSRNDPSFLYRGVQLAAATQAADRWAAAPDRHPAISAIQRGFLRASQRAAIRTRRQRRGAVAILAALALVATIASAFAFQQRESALTQRNQAFDNDVASTAAGLANRDPSLAAQFTIAAYQLQHTSNLQASLLGTENSRLSTPLAVGTGAYWSVAFSPDGRLLAGGSTDGMVRLWYVTGSAPPSLLGQPLVIGKPGFIVLSLAFSPDGAILATGDVSGSLQLWNVTDPVHPEALGGSLTPTGTGRAISTVAFSPNGEIMAAGDARGTVRLWDVTNPADPRPLGTPLTVTTAGLAVYSLAFSPDGRTLASASAVETGGGSVQLWDVAQPASPRRVSVPLPPSTTRALSVAFSPVGPVLAAATSQGTVQMWNVAVPAEPRPLGQLAATNPGNNVFSVAFSANGSTLVTGGGDGTVRLWNVSQPTAAAPLGQPLTASVSALVLAAAVSSDGMVASGGDGGLRLWSAPHTVLDSLSQVGAVAFSPKNRVLASGGLDGVVQFWDVADPARPRLLGDTPSVADSPIYSVAFSADGNVLASGDGDGTIRVWDVSDPAQPQLMGPAFADSASGEPVYSVAFSPDRPILASGSGDGMIRMWDMAQPARPQLIGSPEVAASPGNGVQAVAFRPDGALVASGSTDGTVRLWRVSETASPQPSGRAFFAASGGTTVHSLAFGPRGNVLATGGSDGIVRLWNVADPASVRLLHLPYTAANAATSIYSVAFSPNGDLLASGSADGAIQLWNVANPAQLTLIGAPFQASDGITVYSVAFSPDSQTLATGSADTTTRLWSINVPYAISRICDTAANNLTAQVWHIYIPAQLPYRPPCDQQAAAATAQAPAPAGSPGLGAASLTGTWSGTYLCATQGEAGLRLVIQAGPDGTLAAVASSYPLPGNPHIAPDSWTLTGTYAATGIALAQGHWVTQAPNHVMVNFSASAPGDNGTVLSGTVGYPGCTSFTVSRSG